VTGLTNLGMQVTASSSAYGIAEGWVPVPELPTIAQLPQTMTGSPIDAPILNALGGFQGFQGTAYNEAETSVNADAARSQFGVTGAGVTVGVLSDSVSKSGMGLLGSYISGDLNAANPVNVIQDGPSGSTDEGRAMLENVHDIAPGANLQFATGEGGELSFMQNIEALYNSGSKVIVDDLGYFDEPMFQDGLIAQGVDFVTARGDEYFSAAGNEGPDSGYLSTFRPDVTTVNGISGTFQNFNPNGGTANPLLPIKTSGTNVRIEFQFDQPYGAQEPAGATAHTTSNVDFYVFNSSGGIVASGTANNVATNKPLQQVIVPSAGCYTVAIVVASGTNPGHVEFMGQNDSNSALNVSQQFGTAGGRSYPSTLGHEASSNTIGVGAMPWWASTPFVGQSPLANEPFSSSGAQLIDLSPKGTPIVAQVTQNPAITSPDGGTTSFFGQGGINTTLFSPTSSFNFVPTGQQSLRSFFGTSSAAPNAAAVAALMLQEVPTLNRVQILQALESTATPMNSTPAGTWNVQSGFGLINAVAAINAVAPPTLATSTTTSTPSTKTPVLNQSFSLSASVAGNGATPTGSVDFYDVSYNTDFGSFALAGGTASTMITPTQLGAHIYLATYSGDSTYASSTAYVVLNVVQSAPAVLADAFLDTGMQGSSQTASDLIALIPDSTAAAAIPIPLTLGAPTPSGPLAASDVTVGTTATTATDANPAAKKYID
jgi:large repetitive protein